MVVKTNCTWCVNNESKVYNNTTTDKAKFNDTLKNNSHFA